MVAETGIKGDIRIPNGCTSEVGRQNHKKSPQDSSFSTLGKLLPFAEVHIHAVFLDAGSLPPFRGATIRGGMGYHLKRTVCHIKASSCSDCLVASSCSYAHVFEGVPPANRDFMRLYPYIPQPFIILTDLNDKTEIKKGDDLLFGLRLFGQAIDFFPYIAYSLIELGKIGLGKDKIKFRIKTISQAESENAVYEENNNRIKSLEHQHCNIQTNSLQSINKVDVNFLTPVKMRVDGKDAHSITFLNLLRAALRRISILTHFYGTPFSQNFDSAEFLTGADIVKAVAENVKWYSFERFSGRQKQKIPMGGLVGKMSFEGDLCRHIPLLKMVEITNLGKATSFGFGRIKIKY